VMCMALYGALIAIKAGLDYRDNAMDPGLASAAQQAAPDLWRELCTRQHALKRHDAALVVSGVAQAVGAVALCFQGPIWLSVLLPGTLALGVLKYSRMRLVGQWPVTHSAALVAESGHVAGLCPPTFADQLFRLDSVRAELRLLERYTATSASKPERWIDSVCPLWATGTAQKASIGSALHRSERWVDVWSELMVPAATHPGHKVLSNAFVDDAAKNEAQHAWVSGPEQGFDDSEATYLSQHVLRLCRFLEVVNDRRIKSLPAQNDNGGAWIFDAEDLAAQVESAGDDVDACGRHVDQLSAIALKVMRPASKFGLQQRYAFLQRLVMTAPSAAASL
jgi:hypothetical protein